MTHARFRQDRFLLDAGGATPGEVLAPSGRYWSAFDDFYGMADVEAAHGFILNAGSDDLAVDPVIDTAQAGGVWVLVGGDGDGTTAEDASQLVWADMPIQIDSILSGGVVTLEARIRIKAAITGVAVNFGLTDATGLEEPFSIAAATVTSTATDAVCFCYDDGATAKTWHGLAVDTDVDDTGNASTGVGPVADTFQILKIEVSATGAECWFYIDGERVLSLTGSVGCGPDVVLYPTLICCSDGAAAKSVDIDWIRVYGPRA